MKKLFILVLGALFALSFTVSAETVIYEFKPVQGDFSKRFIKEKRHWENVTIFRVWFLPEMPNGVLN